VPKSPVIAAGLTGRIGIVALAGAALGLTWQPWGFWPLLFLSLPALTLAVRDQPLRRSFGLGYLYGLVMLTVAINWLHVLGVWVAALLILFEALFFGLLGLGLTLVGRLRLWPLAAACCWVLIEFAYSRIPFGGFGWTRIAYAAVDTPLAGFLPFLGVAGLSFVVALTGQLIAWLVLSLRTRRAGEPRRPGRLLAVAAVLVALVAVPIGLRGYQVESADTPSVNPCSHTNTSMRSR